MPLDQLGFPAPAQLARVPQSKVSTASRRVFRAFTALGKACRPDPIGVAEMHYPGFIGVGMRAAH